MGPVSDLPDHVARNRAFWDEQAEDYRAPGERNWATDEPVWGLWRIPESQAGILGIGAIEKRAVVVSDGGLDALAIRLRCYISLTFDHRLIDGATGDRFLQLVKHTLEHFGG